LLYTLAQKGYAVVGVDYSRQMARHAARYSGQPVARGDGRTLPFRDEQFATLVTTFPAPYVLELHTQREFARVVRPGGLWLWVDNPTLNFTGPFTLLARLLLTWGTWEPHPDRSVTASPLHEDHSEGLWKVNVTRVRVGPSSVAVRIARRRDNPKI
ncbi:MAG: class I SAM-dependent methyltransferase, partial [Chloroflexota bacterium]|nr:class I SAM-dependent methyltransferase [Chloroflexota bacterium]